MIMHDLTKLHVAADGYFFLFFLLFKGPKYLLLLSAVFVVSWYLQGICHTFFFLCLFFFPLGCTGLLLVFFFPDALRRCRTTSKTSVSNLYCIRVLCLIWTREPSLLEIHLELVEPQSQPWLLKFICLLIYIWFPPPPSPFVKSF